jgi:biopolymer transport protein ExbD
MPGVRRSCDSQGQLILMRRIRPPKYFILPLALLSAVMNTLAQQQPPISDPLLDPSIIKESSVVVTIDTDNDFRIGRKKVTRLGVAQAVEDGLKDKPPEEQIVYIRAAESVSYGTVVSVLDSIRATGVERIGLVAYRPAKEKGCPKQAEGKSEGKEHAKNSRVRQHLIPALMHAAEIIVRVNSVVDGSPQVELNYESMLLAELTAKLKALLEGREDKTVIITARGDMPYCDVRRVMDVVSAAGAGAIKLKTER